MTNGIAVAVKYATPKREKILKDYFGIENGKNKGKC